VSSDLSGLFGASVTAHVEYGRDSADDVQYGEMINWLVAVFIMSTEHGLDATGR